MQKHKSDIVRSEIDYDSDNKDYTYQHLLSTYKKHVRPDSVVVEIGASNKHRTNLLAEHCSQLVGIEYYSGRLPVDFGNVIYKQADWQNLSETLENNSFDLLVSSQCLEHIPDDLAAINETHRVLKPGGIAIINTPNRRRFIRRVIELVAGERKFPWWEHVREYSKEDLIKLFDKSAFKNYKVIPVGLGIKPLKYLGFKNCPEALANVGIHWEIILFKEYN